MPEDIKFSRRARSRFFRRGILILVTLTACCLDRIGLWTISAQEAGVEELQEPEFIPPPSSIERRIVEYQAGNQRDPFQGLAKIDVTQGSGIVEAKSPKSEKPLPRLAIQGIVWGGKFPQAIIDNRVVKVGDRIKLGTREGATIIDIDKEGVVVVFEGQEYKLPAPARSTSSKNPSGG